MAGNRTIRTDFRRPYSKVRTVFCQTENRKDGNSKNGTVRHTKTADRAGKRRKRTNLAATGGQISPTLPSSRSRAPRLGRRRRRHRRRHPARARQKRRHRCRRRPQSGIPCDGPLRGTRARFHIAGASRCRSRRSARAIIPFSRETSFSGHIESRSRARAVPADRPARRPLDHPLVRSSACPSAADGCRSSARRRPTDYRKYHEGRWPLPESPTGEIRGPGNESFFESVGWGAPRSKRPIFDRTDRKRGPRIDDGLTGMTRIN